MAEITSKIILDVSKNNVFDYILAKQGDKSSRFLEIDLQNDGKKITVSSTAKVYLNAEKPDKHITRTAGVVLEDGSVKVGLTNQTLAVDGMVTCDVTIEDEGKKLTSLKFIINVEQSTAGDDVIISTDGFTQLDEMVERVEALDKSVAEHESLRTSNEIARQTAENSRVNNNTEVKNLIDSFVGNMVIANTAIPGAVKAGGDITISTAGIISLTNAIKLQIRNDDNPIGTVRYFAVATNPSILLGFGTWVQVAKGRTVVGVYADDTDFNTVGNYGGAKTHTLTEPEMPEHNLEYNLGRKVSDSLSFTNTFAVGASATDYNVAVSTAFVGSNQPHNNMPPYECYYIWKRTA